jgi:pimeloyl-ACP methyl ester carboxylesterase
MGLYDVSSEIDLIRKKTNGSKIIYFGHSLGSAIGLVYSSLKPDEAKNYLKSMILAAPSSYFQHSNNIMGFTPNIQILFLVITNST